MKISRNKMKKKEKKEILCVGKYVLEIEKKCQGIILDQVKFDFFLIINKIKKFCFIFYIFMSNFLGQSLKKITIFKTVFEKYYFNILFLNFFKPIF